MQPATTAYQQYMYAYPHKTAYRAIDVDIRPYLQYLSQQKNHIYIHLPFCESKCKFCNLFSVAGSSTSFIDAYINAMEHQLAQLSTLTEVQNAKFSSVVIGGGTPLLLSVNQLTRLFGLVEKYLPIDLESTYVNIETSPNQSTEEKLQLLKNIGVNRISIGIQSFNNGELKQLGRAHDAQLARQAIERINGLGFEELNIDLIYGIPTQTIESLKLSAQEAVAYRPHEIFIYPLYMKVGTALHGKASGYTDQRLEMYHVVRSMLLEAGYAQTSMRRFVLGEPHSVSCGFENTIALGCGGRSYLGNLHFCEPFSVNPRQCRNTIEQYLLKTDFLQATHGYVLDLNEQKCRYAIKNLLFHTGVDLHEYYQLFDSAFSNDFCVVDEYLLPNKLAIEVNNRIMLTPEGLSLSDSIGPMFISSSVQQKMDSYRLF